MSSRHLKSVIITLLAILFFSIPAKSQEIQGRHRGIFSGGGSGTWTVIQTKYWDSLGVGTGGGTCNNAGSTCNVTVSSIAAGNYVLAVMPYFANSSLTLSSVSGETFTHCGGTNGCAFYDTSNSKLGVDASYVLSATGGETSFTCTASAASGGYIACIIIEVQWSGSTKTFDSSNGAAEATCTSCSGQALTLTGAKDVIVQLGVVQNSMTAISGGAGYSATFPDGVGIASAVNTTNGAAPTWTQDVTGRGVVMAIAVKGS